MRRGAVVGGLALSVLLPACTVDVTETCRRTADCDDGHVCVRSFCLPRDAGPRGDAAPRDAVLPFADAERRDARPRDARADGPIADVVGPDAAPDAAPPDAAPPDASPPDAAPPDAAPRCPEPAPPPPGPAPVDPACRPSDWRVRAARATDTTGRARRPAVAWTGAELAVAWEETRAGRTSVRLARFRPDGTRLGEEIVLAGGEGVEVGEPAVAWSGRELGVVWSERRARRPSRIVFARLAPDGSRCGPARVLSTGNRDATAPAIAGNGDGWGVFWTDARHAHFDLYFAPVDAEGQPGADQRFTDDVNDDFDPSVAWDGERYAVASAQHDPDDQRTRIYFALADREGRFLSSIEHLSSNRPSGAHPSVAGTESFYGVAWQTAETIELTTYHRASGNRGFFIIRDDVAGVYRPSLVGVGRTFIVAWEETHPDDDVWFIRHPEDGIGRLDLEPVRVSNDAGRSEHPALVWTGDGVAVAWNDAGGAVDNVNLATARLQCSR